MPVRLCIERGCRNPAKYRGRCTQHAQTNERSTHPNKRFYNSKRWQITRRWILHDDPLCECGAIATDVDHIVPLEQGGAPWARTNLQPLCQACHARKTRREQVGGPSRQGEAR